MKNILTLEETGKYLRINLRQVYRLINTQRLKAVKISEGDKRPRYVVTKDQLKDFIKEATE